MELLPDANMVIFFNIEMFKINTLYTINLHNIICQLYLNKTGKIISNGEELFLFYS